MKVKVVGGGVDCEHLWLANSLDLSPLDFIFRNAVQSELRNMTPPPTDLSVRYTEYYKERYKNTLYVDPKNKEYLR